MSKRPLEDIEPVEADERRKSPFVGAEDVPTSPSVQVQCTMPPHPALTFHDLGAYESHYAESHSNRCSECGRNFPTPHFLDLHIAENHDPLNEVRRARGDKTYSCFVEGCDKICLTWVKRRMHLVDKHGFPRNYDFFVVNDGIDRKKSLLRPSERSNRRLSIEIDVDATSTNEGRRTFGSTRTPFASSPARRRAASSAQDDSQQDMQRLTKSMSALNFTPRSVRFGRGSRAGLAKS